MNGNENLENYTANTISGVIDFVVNYGLYNSGWILDSCEIDTSGENGYGVFTALSGRNMNEEQLMSDLYMGGSDENVEIADYYCSPDMQYESYSLKHTNQKKYAIETWQNEISYSFVNTPSEYDEPGTWATSSFLVYDEYEWHIDGKYVYNNRIVTIPYSEPQENMTLNRDGNDWSFSKMVSTEEISLRQLGGSLDCEDEIAAGYSVGFWDGENYSELTDISYNDFNYIAVAGGRWPDVLLFGPDKIALLGNEGTVDNIGRKVYFEIMELERVDDSFVPIKISGLTNLWYVQYLEQVNKFIVLSEQNSRGYEYHFVDPESGKPYSLSYNLKGTSSCGKIPISVEQEDGSKKYGFSDEFGSIVIPCEYDYCYDFSEVFKLAPVKRDEKWGCIDTSGNEVIPVIYDDVNLWELNSKIIVESSGKYGVVSADGTVIVPPIYDYIPTHVTYGRRDVNTPVNCPFVVVEEGKYWILDNDGNKQGYFEGDYWIDSFGDGLFLVCDKEFKKYGYLNLAGSLTIPLLYDYANPFSDGQASVETDGNWKIIDKTGSDVFPFDYYDNVISSREETICVSKDEKYGIIDFEGNVLVPLEYNLVYYHDSLIIAENVGITDLYDVTGKKIATLENSEIYKFLAQQSELMIVRNNEKWTYGIVDFSGNVVVPFEYDNIEMVSDSDGRYFYVQKGEVWGIIENPQWRQEG